MTTPSPARFLLLAALTGAACHHRVFMSGTFRGDMASQWGLRERAEKVLRVELAKEGDPLFDLRAEAARVEVRTSTSEPPHLVARFEVAARTLADAESALAHCTLQVDDGRTVRTRTQAIVYEDGGTTLMVHPEVRLEAVVRPGTRVAIGTQSGSVEVTGPVAGCRVEAGHGSVHVQGSQGGEIQISSQTGALTVRDAAADFVALRTGHGTIEVRGVRGLGLTATTSSGSVRVASAAAERIEIATGHGRIDLEGVSGDCTARTTSGAIDLVEVKGGVLRLDSGYGTIRARRCSGRLTAETDSGGIDLECTGSEVSARSGYGTVEVRGDVRQAELRTSSGHIELSLASAQPSGPFRCVSGHGDVRVDLPAGMAAELDAEAPSGAVTLSGLAVSGEQSRQRARGRSGEGGAHFELLARSGNVSVRQAR